MAVLQMEQEEESVRPGREWKNRKGGNKIGGPGLKSAAAGVGLKEAGKTAAALVRAAAKGAGRKRTSKKDGAEMLKQASDQALVEITDIVVSELREKAKKGDVVCVKALMSFSEGKKPREKPKKRRRGPTLAERLRDEREWVGPPDGDLDVRFGGREPE